MNANAFAFIRGHWRLLRYRFLPASKPGEIMVQRR
jgi:hypothetical protein